MTVRFHLLDAYDELPLHLLDPIRRELDQALETVLSLMPMDRVDIVVAPGPWVIDEYGLTGMTHGKGRITITIDPDSTRLNDRERAQRILAVLAHELHHVARGRGPGYGRTLGEALVTEGLAQCFEVEMGAPVPFYAVDLDAESLTRANERAKAEARRNPYDHNAWFFGRRNDPQWPRNAGYSLGFTIVEAWLRANDASALSSATIHPEAILAPWLAGELAIAPPHSFSPLVPAKAGTQS